MTISLYCNMVGRIPKNSTNPKHPDKKMNLILKVNQVSKTYKSRNSITGIEDTHNIFPFILLFFDN